MKCRLALVALVLFAGGLLPARAGEPAGPLLVQKPTLSKTHIVFAYAGDLWIVPRTGGEAKRLTSGAGVETDPAFSPDGKFVAFTGQYDGNDDVFVVPTEGGTPRRLTYHPGADQVVGWTPDGKRILFRSSRASYSRFTRLYTIGLDGGHPEEVPLPIADTGSYSPDGKRIVYSPWYNGSRSAGFNVAWKRYGGGRQPVLWIANLSDSSIEKLPHKGSNDTCPMWIGNQIYFLSDREGPVTLYAYDSTARSAKRLIDNDSMDIKSASAGPDAIVYEKPGEILLFDLETRKSKNVPITINADLPTVRPHFVRVDTSVVAAGLSPSGARAVFEARGEIFTVPASKGQARNITRSPAVHDRDPAWSPDGKSIAYFSDESGEYELCIRDHLGKGKVKRITPGDAPSFYYNPQWSPDNKKIAYTDKRSNLWITDVGTGKSTKADFNRFGGRRLGSPSWSPDSNWLAYTKELKSHLSAVFLYSLENAKATQVSDGMSDAGSTVFDKSGKYLYFTASTDAGPGLEWGMSAFGRSSSRSVYLVVLSAADPSPLAPESDEEKGEQARTEDSRRRPMGGGPRGPVTVKVDLEDIDQRILSLPVPAASYMRLVPGREGTLFLLQAAGGGAGRRGGGGGGFGGATVQRFDMTTKRATQVLDGVSNFTVSDDGSKMLYRQGTRWVIASASGRTGGAMAQAGATGRMGAGGGGRGRGRGGPGAPAPATTEEGADNTLDLSGLEVRVDPRAEWRQIYREAWRIQRDFLYDPGFHGLDIRATERKYERFLSGIAHRNDLGYLLEECLGELSLGHLRTGVAGGRGRGRGGEESAPRGGLLGADYTIDNGRYRFARIYRGENWNPALTAPLTQPGAAVREGEYLLAIDDEDLKGTDSVHRLLENKAGKVVTLTVGPSADGKGSREVKVTPVASEQQLRHYAWVTDNRAKVAKATGGKVAYIYLPDTGMGGSTRFNREFYAQVGNDGAIIDERFNGGGSLADQVIDALGRKVRNFVATREGEDTVFPRGIFGPKVMIINESAGSGGDYMPYAFRQARLGTLVGKKTWGGLVGVGGYPSLLDGSTVTAPHMALWFPNGKWDVENIGVSPDVEVEMDPKAWREGRDPQLEKAIEIVKEELAKNPLKWPKRPAYPNYHPKKAAAVRD
jgi:tricorn protease